MGYDFLEMAQLICWKNDVYRLIAMHQIARLIREWVQTNKNKIYLNKIKDVLKHEIVRRKNPYSCSKCNKDHHRGDIYEKHSKYIILPSDLGK